MQNLGCKPSAEKPVKWEVKSLDLQTALQTGTDVLVSQDEKINEINGWGTWIRTKINGVRVRFLYLQNQDDMSSTKCLTRTQFIGEFPLLSNEDNGAGPAVAG